MPRTVKDPEERKAELLDTATRTVTKETTVGASPRMTA